MLRTLIRGLWLVSAVAALWLMLPATALEPPPPGAVAPSVPDEGRWSKPVHQPGISMITRSAPILSADLLMQATLAARFHISDPGWFFRVPVEPGEYGLRLALGDAPATLVFRFVDSDDNELATQSMDIARFSDALPSLRRGFQRGFVSFEWRVEETKLDLMFVSRREHDRALGTGLQEYRSGRVVIRSDLAMPDMLQELARRASVAMGYYAQMLEVETTRESYVLYVLQDRERMRRVSRVLGGTEEGFEGFASSITRKAYMRYDLPDEPELLVSSPPRHTRHVAYHELVHLLVFDMHPFASGMPTWLHEGIAESLSLSVPSDPLGDGMMPGFSTLRQNYMTREDLLVSSSQTLTTGGYSASRRVVQAALDDGTLAERVWSVFDAGSPANMTWKALTAFELHRNPERDTSLWYNPDRDQTWPFALGSAEELATPGVYWAASNGAGVALPPAPPSSHEGVGAYFAFLDWGDAQQVDFYLSYAAGNRGGLGLKVAILPNLIGLADFVGDQWVWWSSFELPKPLETGTLKNPVWHSAHVKLTHNEENNSYIVEIELNGEAYWLLWTLDASSRDLLSNSPRLVVIHEGAALIRPWQD